jgi:hypothetical protein
MSKIRKSLLILIRKLKRRDHAGDIGVVWRIII